MIRGPGLLLPPASTAPLQVLHHRYSGLRVYRGLYRRKPSSVHAGFNSYSVVFDDYRSIIIYGDNPLEIGIPLAATAYTGSSFYGVSGKWLVRVGGDGSYEPLVLLGITTSLQGFPTAYQSSRVMGGSTGLRVVH